MTVLDEAINRLYEAFSEYRPNEPIPYCTCGCNARYAREIEPQVRTRALRMLDDDATTYLAGSLTYTVGDCKDYKYFLPRLLQSAWDYPVAESHGRRIVKCGFEDWPAHEREAVFRFIDALWHEYFSHDPFDFRDYVNDLVDLSKPLDHNWERVIHDFIAADGDMAQCHLLSFLHEQITGSPVPEWAQVEKLLHAPEIRRALDNAMAREDIGEPYAEIRWKLKASGIIDAR